MPRTRAPDGGWGWVVALAAMMIQSLFGCIIRGFGVLYLSFLERYGGSATATTWIGTSLLITWGLTGPIGGWLMKQFSCRALAMSGCLILSCGVLATGLAPSLTVAYITFGTAGCGLSLAFNASFLIVDQYFTTRKALAMGLVTLGAAMGMFLWPPIIELILETYHYTGGMIMLTGITLQGCIASSLFYPLPQEDTPITSKPKQNGKPECLLEKDTTTVTVSAPVEYHDSEKKTCKIFGGFHKLVKYFKLFEEPYFAYIVFNSFALFHITYNVGAFSPALAVHRGLNKRMATILVTAIGGFDAAGKVITALCFDLPCVRTYRSHIYASLGIMSGLVAAFLPFSSDYASLFVMCSIFGLVSGGVGGQRNTILTDLLPPEQVPDALGLTLFTASLGCILSSLSTGFIKDMLGSYDVAFYITASIMLSSASLLTLLLIVRKPHLNKAKIIDVLDVNVTD